MILGWLALQKGRGWRYIDLAQELGLSQSESHASVKRLLKAGLVLPGKPFRPGSFLIRSPQLNSRPALNFIIHGVPYAFYPERGSITRGMPTGAAAPPLRDDLDASEHMPVWPDAEGTARGYELKPLYRSAPEASRKNSKLYEFLALIDALRDGRARERKLAKQYLEKIINGEQG